MAFNLELPTEQDQLVPSTSEDNTTKDIPLSAKTSSIIDEWANTDTEVKTVKSETTPKTVEDYKKAVENPQPAQTSIFDNIGEKVSNLFDYRAKLEVDARTAFVGGLAEVVQGAEDLAVDAFVEGGERIDRAFKAIDEALGGDKSPYDGLTMEDTKPLREQKVEKLHHYLKIDTYAKALLGDKYKIPSTEDIIKVSQNRSNEIEDSEDGLRRAAYIVGETASYIGTWEASAAKLLERKGITTIVKDGLKIGKSPKNLRAKDIAIIGGAEGVLSGVQGVGKHHEDDEQYNKALTDALIGAGMSMSFATVLKGAGFATHNWFAPVVNGQGAKIVASLQDHAIDDMFKGDKRAFKDAVDRIGKASEDGSWDNMSNFSKIKVLAGMSRAGQRGIQQTMGDMDAFVAMNREVNANNNEIKTLIKNIDFLAKEDNSIGGKRLQHILTEDAVIPSGKGVNLPNKYGLEYKWIDAVMPNKGNSVAEITKVQNVIRGLGTTTKNRLEELGLQALKDGKKVEKVHLTEFTDALRHRLALKPHEEELKTAGINPANPKEGELPPDLMPNAKGVRLRRESKSRTTEAVVEALKDQGAIKKEVIGYTQSGEPIKGDIVSITPETLYKVYNTVRDSIDHNRGLDPKVAERLTQQSKDVLLDMLEHVGYGANYKRILSEAMDAYGAKKKLLERIGLKALIEGGDSTLSSKDITNMYIDVVKRGLNAQGGSADYQKFMSMLSREHQVEIEKAIIGSVIQQGSKTLSIISKSRGSTEAEIEESLKRQGIDSIRSAEELLDGLAKMSVTKEGRQLVDMARTLTSATRGITRGFHNAVVEETLNTAVMRGVRGVLSRLYGSIQNRKDVISNIPYMTAKIKALGELAERQGNQYDSVMTVKSYKKALAAGQLTFSEPHQIQAGLEIARMMKNMARISLIDNDNSVLSPLYKESKFTPPKPPETPTGGIPNPPETPTPPSTGGVPTPPSSPGEPSKYSSLIPEGLQTKPGTEIKLSQKVLDDIAKNGRLSDHVQLLPAELVELHETQKQLVKNILNNSTPPNMAGEAKADMSHWEAFNKELIKAQNGKGLKVIVDPSGSPMVVVGSKGIPVANRKIYGAAGNKTDWLHSLLAKKHNTSSKRETSIYNILDRDYLVQMGKLVGKPNLFDDLKVKLVSVAPNKGGAYSPADKTIEVNVNKYVKGKDDAAFMGRIMDTLSHEMQHHIQHSLNIPSGSNGFLSEIEAEFRVDTIIKNLRLDNGTTTDKKLIKSLLLQGKNSSPFEINKGPSVGIRRYRDLFRKYGIPPETPPHKAVLMMAKANGVNVDDSYLEALKNVLNTHLVYLSSMGEAQARFTGQLARAKGVDLSNPEEFRNFLNNNGEYLNLLWTTNPPYRALTNDIATGVLLAGHKSPTTR